MKRAGHLLGAVAEQENLRLAFWQAARGKGDRPVVQAFRQNLAEELRRMSEGILRVDYPVGRYHRFVIYDPKERVIHAARFSERVLHHALMTVCEPLFERWLIDDTYACRRGKGHCHTERRKARWFGNPKGIVSSRPGLPSPRGYPGLTPVRFSTPTGLCPRSAIEPQSLGLADTTPLFPG